MENMANGEVFKRKSAVKWLCINYGYVVEGTEAPQKCPARGHPQSFCEFRAEKY